MNIGEKIINFLGDVLLPGDFKSGDFRDRSKMGTNQFLGSYKDFLVSSFRNSPRMQQESYIRRFAQIVCIGIACIVLNSFYPLLSPPIRIIALPIVLFTGWHAAEVFALLASDRFALQNTDQNAVRELKESVTFGFALIVCTCLGGVMLHYSYSELTPQLRTIGLPMVIFVAWNAAKVFILHVNRRLLPHRP